MNTTINKFSDDEIEIVTTQSTTQPIKDVVTNLANAIAHLFAFDVNQANQRQSLVDSISSSLDFINKAVGLGIVVDQEQLDALTAQVKQIVEQQAFVTTTIQSILEKQQAAEGN